MIGPINPNPYIHWLNKNVLPEVYSEPSQTPEMKLFRENTKQPFRAVP